jgi:hypothetical protein
VFAYVLFLVGALCTLSAAILGESVYIVKQSEHARAARYAQLIAEQSSTLYLLAARSQVSAGGVSGLATGTAWSMHGSACDASVSNCLYAYDAQALVGLGTGVAVSAQQPSNDSAMNLQQSYLGEQRASAQLQIRVEDKNGNVIARVMRSLTLRVFNIDPWVIISGNKQYSAHTTDDVSAQGDTGGVPAQPGDLAAPDPNYPNGFRDTRIHVTVQCLNDGAGGGTQGNEGTGGVQVSCAGAASPAPADAFDPSPQPWHNIGGEGVPAGWSP